mmetsp:Transcript_66791/g.74828  ORF Transcript_66791/g.74828 Transcript_66791/m.74828 type:complete len:111 (-) Transcript_66791:82-414(-)
MKAYNNGFANVIDDSGDVMIRKYSYRRSLSIVGSSVSCLVVSDLITNVGNKRNITSIADFYYTPRRDSLSRRSIVLPDQELQKKDIIDSICGSTPSKDGIYCRCTRRKEQ